MNSSLRRLIRRTCLILLLLSISAIAGSEKRIPVPEEVFFYEPAATVFGPAASWVNPAALAVFDVAGFQLMADYEQGDYAKNWGFVVFRDRVATSYRRINNPSGEDFKEWITAAGMRFGQKLSIGLSYRYFASGPGIYNNRHMWILGFKTRSRGPFSLGAVFSNLNHGKVDGEESAAEQRYSLGYRPTGTQLTLAVDMFLSSKDNLSKADFRYHAEYTPIPGLYFNGFIDSDRNFQFGMRANLLKYFVGSKSVFDKKGNNGRTTAYVGATNKRQPSLITPPPRRLRVAVSGSPSENPPRPVFGRRRPSFATLLIELYRAAEDSSIGEMVIDLRSLALGFGQAQELRQAMAYFKSAGKKIVCHITSPNNIGYYVASVADRIFIPPISQLRLVGLRAELTFWAGTLEKLGVKVELLHIGKFKTAPERFTHTAASEENKKQLNRLLDDLYDQFIGDIASGRGVSADSVARLINNGPFTSAEALRYGLVDGLSYRDEMEKSVLSRMPEISFAKYRSDTLLNDSWTDKPTVAVVVVDGSIVPNSGSSNLFDRSGGVKPFRLERALGRAVRDPNVGGIVLRVNSPGGYALAGDEIHHAVAKAAGEKLLAVSMASVAASGGYYIAAPAERIFANPACITGSIGIYGGKADLSSLYEKIAVGKELFTRGRFAGMLTNTRPFSDTEREKYYSHLRAFYDHFVDLVADSRSLAVDSVDNLGRGRVWTGREARSNGLVDELGGLKQALDYVAAENNLSDYRIELYPKRRPLFLFPGSKLFRSVASIFVGGQVDADDLPIPMAMPADGSLFTRMPYDIVIE